MYLASILFVGLVLRLISINQSLWLDEATSAILARDFSIPDILAKFSPGDFHPPLYYLILKLWSFIFGTSELGLRSLSVVAGVGGVYLVYLLANKLFNKKVALISSALLATSGLHIYFSQEVRMYMMASFFVLLSVYYFVKIIENSGVGDLALFSIFVCASVATNYMTVFIIPVFWLFGYLKKKNIIWFKKLLASHIVLGVFGLLWLPTFLKQLSIGSQVRILSPVWWSTLGKSNIKDALLVPVKFVIGRISYDNKFVYVLIVVFVSLFFSWLLFRALRLIRVLRNSSLVWLWLTVPYTLAFVIGFKLSVFGYFRLLYLLPAFYILVALGADSLGRNTMKILFVLITLINLLLSGYYLLNPRFHRENWRGLVEYIKQDNRLDRDVVIFVTYNQREAFKYYDPKGEIRVNGPALIKEGYGIIWLMRYAQPIFDPGDKVKNQVESLGYSKAGEYDFNGVSVWKYVR